VIQGRSRDLIAVIAVASVTAVLALFLEGGPVAIAVFLPLVLVLPGYALTALFFPPGSIGRDFRLLLTVSLSIAATALAGVAFQVVLDLSRGAFVVLLAAIAVAAAVQALRSRTEAGDGGQRQPLAMPRWAAPAAAAIALAVAISVAAVALATDGVERQLDESHFSALWLVPKGSPGRPPNSPPVAVGVANHTQRELKYRLRVHRGSSTIRAWRLRLAPGEEWHATLPAGPFRGSAPLVARLYQAGRPVRRVALVLEPASGS
jgi:uncharacterized membrane protein